MLYISFIDDFHSAALQNNDELVNKHDNKGVEKTIMMDTSQKCPECGLISHKVTQTAQRAEACDMKIPSISHWLVSHS